MGVWWGLPGCWGESLESLTPALCHLLCWGPPATGYSLCCPWPPSPMRRLPSICLATSLLAPCVNPSLCPGSGSPTPVLPLGKFCWVQLLHVGSSVLLGNIQAVALRDIFVQAQNRDSLPPSLQIEEPEWEKRRSVNLSELIDVYRWAAVWSCHGETWAHACLESQCLVAWQTRGQRFGGKNGAWPSGTTSQSGCRELEVLFSWWPNVLMSVCGWSLCTQRAEKGICLQWESEQGIWDWGTSGREMEFI